MTKFERFKTWLDMRQFLAGVLLGAEKLLSNEAEKAFGMPPRDARADTLATEDTLAAVKVYALGTKGFRFHGS